MVIEAVVPASAGMSPLARRDGCHTDSRPRQRGDEPASAILSDLDRAGVRVLRMTTAEVGAAFEIMIESVNEGLVVHPGQAEFTESVKYAQPRKMGRWRTWEQSSPTIPATQTQAATLALWGLKKHESRGGSRTIPSDPVSLGADRLTVSEGVVGILT